MSTKTQIFSPFSDVFSNCLRALASSHLFFFFSNCIIKAIQQRKTDSNTQMPQLCNWIEPSLFQVSHTRIGSSPQRNNFQQFSNSPLGKFSLWWHFVIHKAVLEFNGLKEFLPPSSPVPWRDKKKKKKEEAEDCSVSRRQSETIDQNWRVEGQIHLFSQVTFFCVRI